jgi:hypothetical protein
MKFASRFALSIALLAMAACGGSNAADKTGPNGNGDPDRATASELVRGVGPAAAAKSAAAAKATAAAADLLRLDAVRLSTDNFFANVDLSAQVDVAPPVPDGVAFEYRWYVNNQVVADAKDATLKSGNFRKHQWILCEARALAGDRVSVWVQSNWVRAADSPPQIEPAAVDNFSVPGRFTYQIKASDVDNDELTYELISPLDVGIELGKKTGLLTWKLDKALVEKLGETMEIQIGVSDNDLPPTTGSITLRFQKGTGNKTP